MKHRNEKEKKSEKVELLKEMGHQFGERIKFNSAADQNNQPLDISALAAALPQPLKLSPQQSANAAELPAACPEGLLHPQGLASHSKPTLGVLGGGLGPNGHFEDFRFQVGEQNGEHKTECKVTNHRASSRPAYPKPICQRLLSFEQANALTRPTLRYSREPLPHIDGTYEDVEAKMEELQELKRKVSANLEQQVLLQKEIIARLLSIEDSYQAGAFDPARHRCQAHATVIRSGPCPRAVVNCNKLCRLKKCVHRRLLEIEKQVDIIKGRLTNAYQDQMDQQGYNGRFLTKRVPQFNTRAVRIMKAVEKAVRSIKPFTVEDALNKVRAEIVLEDSEEDLESSDEEAPNVRLSPRRRDEKRRRKAELHKKRTEQLKRCLDKISPIKFKAATTVATTNSSAVPKKKSFDQALREAWFRMQNDEIEEEMKEEALVQAQQQKITIQLNPEVWLNHQAAWCSMVIKDVLLQVKESRGSLKRATATLKLEGQELMLREIGGQLITWWRATLKNYRRAAIEDLLIFGMRIHGQEFHRRFQLNINELQGLTVKERQITMPKIEDDSLRKDQSIHYLYLIKKMTNDINFAATCLNSMGMMIVNGGEALNQEKTQVLQLALRDLRQELAAIRKSHKAYVKEQMLQRDYYLRGSRRHLHKEHHLSVDQKVAEQQQVMLKALNEVAFIVESEAITICPMGKAVEHGSFPKVEHMLKQRCRPKFRKVVEVLGKEWLSHKALRKRAYIAAKGDDRLLFEGESDVTVSEAWSYQTTPQCAVKQ